MIRIPDEETVTKPAQEPKYTKIIQSDHHEPKNINLFTVKRQKSKTECRFIVQAGNIREKF